MLDASRISSLNELELGIAFELAGLCSPSPGEFATELQAAVGPLVDGSVRILTHEDKRDLDAALLTMRSVSTRALVRTLSMMPLAICNKVAVDPLNELLPNKTSPGLGQRGPVRRDTPTTSSEGAA